MTFAEKFTKVCSLYEDWRVSFHTSCNGTFVCTGTHDWDSYSGNGLTIEAALDAMILDLETATRSKLF